MSGLQFLGLAPPSRLVFELTFGAIRALGRVHATRTQHPGISGPQSVIVITRLSLGLSAEDASGACAPYRGLPFRQRDDQTVA